MNKINLENKDKGIEMTQDIGKLNEKSQLVSNDTIDFIENGDDEVIQKIRKQR